MKSLLRILFSWAAIMSPALSIGKSVAVLPQTSAVVFAKANRSFQKAQYADAINGYKSLIRKGINDPDVYYNLGNALYKVNQVANAILHYERALAIDPHHRDAAKNLYLALLKAKVNQRAESAGLVREPSLWRRLVGLFSVDEAAWIFISLYLVLFILLFLRRWLRPGVLRAGLGYGSVSILIITLLAGGGLAYHIYEYETVEYAVIMDKDAPVFRVLKGKRKSTGKSLPMGLKVRILEESEAWAKVRTSSGVTGWIERKSLTPIILQRK